MRSILSIQQQRISISRIRAFFTGLTGLVCLAGATSCTKTQAVNSPQDSTYLGRLEFVLKANATFAYYDSTLQIAGWRDSLANPGPFTIVLPNNDAFNSGYLGQVYFGTADYLYAFISAVTRPAVSDYVKYDILRGRWPFRVLPLQANQELPSVSGVPVYVTRYLSGTDTLTTVNGQRVISLDNRASNGLIEVLTGIPNPQIYPTVLQQIQSDTALAYFAAAIQRTHLDTLLLGKGPFTVLAPYNTAFRQTLAIQGLNLGVNIGSLDSIAAADTGLLANIIRYHILPGRYFMNDFLRQLGSDTLRLTMLNGEKVGFTTTTYTSGVFPISPAAPCFVGNGNNYSSPFFPGALLYTNGAIGNGEAFQQNYGDWSTGNGVVHFITNVMIP